MHCFSNIIKKLTPLLVDRKTAIVGKNGSGKTSLLRLLVKELKDRSVAYCPQDYDNTPYDTVAALLGVANKFAAIKYLAQFDLASIDMERKVATLSGGELTRLWLVRTFLTQADFLIFDEPTNNLDQKSKQQFYDVIKKSTKNLVIVSHDRELLELMDQIIELDELGYNIYGGNYSLYLEQKEVQERARQRDLLDAKKTYKKTLHTMQRTKEKLQQRASKGRVARRSKSQSKLILNCAKSRSEKSQSKLAVNENAQLNRVQQKLTEAKNKVIDSEQIKVSLPHTKVSQSKLLVTMSEVYFSYSSRNALIKNFNFALRGPERIAITGVNGSGKTTLIKLMLGELVPQKGNIRMLSDRVHYLDQHVNMLNRELSLLENFTVINPEISIREGRAFLASFLFKGDQVLQKVATLSGGEKIRAALACLLPGSRAPELLILDEPTNHLDLGSIRSLESILNCYQGALIVVSHDSVFLDNIGTTRNLHCVAC